MISTELLIAVGILLIALVVDRVRKRKKNLPPGPIGLPILGYLPFLTKTPYLKFISLGQKYGSIFSLNLGSELVVVLNDGDEIRDAFSRKETLARPPNSPLTFFGVETPFFSANFQLWHEQRRFVVQTMKDLGLGRSKIEGHIQEEIHYFLKVLEQSEGRPIDLIKPLTPSMSNNICSLVFGERYDYDNPERIIMDETLKHVSGNLSQTSVITFFPWMRYLPILPNLLGYEQAVKAFHDIFSLVGRKLFISKFYIEEDYTEDLYRRMFYVKTKQRKVNQHKETLDPKNIRDFIDGYLLEAQTRRATDPETTFTESNLKGITLNLFGAGSETVRTTISWCMYILAAYPEVQKKVHKEIDDVMGSGKMPQFIDYKNMPYCQAVIREVLRWKTVAPINPLRYTLDDMELSGLHIPKGTIIIANLWAVHHDPKYWKDPEEFQPNRFLNEDGTLLKTNYFMPFSVGKRSCPGETMAMMEVFLYFVSILQKFRVSFPKGFNPTFEAELGITYRLKKFEICFIPK